MQPAAAIASATCDEFAVAFGLLPEPSETAAAIAAIASTTASAIPIHLPLPPSDGPEPSLPRAFGAWTDLGGGGVRFFFATAKRDGTWRPHRLRRNKSPQRAVFFSPAPP